jgi:hypothetical protein
MFVVTNSLSAEDLSTIPYVSAFKMDSKLLNDYLEGCCNLLLNQESQSGKTDYCTFYK